FYMVLPKYLAALHRLLPFYGSFSQIGLQGEMHYAALMSLGLKDTAKFIVWPTSLATMTLLAVIVSAVGMGLRAQLVALAVLVTSTTFNTHIWDGKVDLFGATFGLAAYFWTLQSGGANSRRAIGLAGTFCGLAVVAKLSLLVALVPGICLMVGWREI